MPGPYFREQLRQPRYEEIHISPHMDDAAYSCVGRILQSRAQGLCRSLGLLLVRAVLGAHDRLKGEPPPTLSTLQIDDVIRDKADVMRLNPSQTAFF